MGVFSSSRPKIPHTIWRACWGYWPMNEASGTRVSKSGHTTVNAPTGHDLADVNTVTTNTGLVLPVCAQFTSANSEYLGPADPDVEGLGSFGGLWIDSWVYLDSVGANRCIASAVNSATVRDWTLTYLTASARFTFVVYDGATQIGAVAADALGAPSLATWYHAQAWATKLPAKCYIQVTPATSPNLAHPPESADVTGSLEHTVGDVRIGASGATPGAFWNGRIGPTALFFRAPSAKERLLMHNRGMGLALRS